jgi:glycosyltransferase involved in cell wall biosynthesis
MITTKKNILIVSQYFWPENFRINELAVYFKSIGCNVTVLTGEPNYPDGVKFPEYLKNKEYYSIYESIKIVRCPIYPRGNTKSSLFLNYISFIFSASILGIWKLKRLKVDEIFVFQTSPITAAIPAVLLKYIKKARLHLWVLDLWPEALLAMNLLKKGFAYYLAEMLSKVIYYSCEKIYISSMGFNESLSRLAPKKTEIKYLPQWVESDYNQINNFNSSLQKLFTIKAFNIIYAGNLGESQDFESVLKAAKILKTEDINFYLVGNGRDKSKIAKIIEEEGLSTTVRLLGSYPADMMMQIYSYSSVLLVSLRKGPVFSTALPGKIQTYLSTGKPIVGMIDGEGARVLKESGAALIAKAGDYRHLAEVILSMKKMPKNDLVKMGQNGPIYCSEKFDKFKILNSLSKEIILP